MVFLVCCSHPSKLNRSQSNTIDLKKDDGSVVSIPLVGPLQDTSSSRIAQTIISIEDKVDSLKYTSDSINTEFSVELYSLANELRYDAIDQLDLAYRIARRTSSALDPELIDKAEKYIDMLKSLLKKEGSSLFVSTKITTNAQEALLHYMSMGDYKSNKKIWRSYNSGMILKIGRYIFEAQSPYSDFPPYLEEVLILNEPTNLELQIKL
jgi:hypothetical protein